MTALEYGGASAAMILPLVLQFGADVSPGEYPSVILAPLTKLYASPDRGTRMALLDHLPEYAEKLDKKTVSEKIFPHLVWLSLSIIIESDAPIVYWIRGHGCGHSRGYDKIYHTSGSEGRSLHNV